MKQSEFQQPMKKKNKALTEQYNTNALTTAVLMVNYV